MNKCKFSVVLVVSFLLSLSCPIEAQDIDSDVTDFWQCSSPTEGFWGLNDKLTPSGIEISLGLTALYQANIHGGISTGQRRGRHSGRYDLEAAADLEKLLGLEGGALFLHGWGGWPDTEGIDEHSVGSAWGINALSVGNRSMDIVEFFYEGPFFSDETTISIGKLDFTGIFDAVEYADDECGQFLNASLVDDPAIPFPEQGLGLVILRQLTDSWYLMGGVADAQADSRETGFETTFHDEDYYFYALETGATLSLDSANGSMYGTYRVGMWYDDQDKESFTSGRTNRGDTGFYTSCDQMLYKENNDRDDSQGLGAFVRYGWADGDYNSITNFISFGFQYQGLFKDRDDDVLGVGYSKGVFSDKDATNYPADYESVLEAYYNYNLSPWFVISPSIQYVANPTPGDGTRPSDALIAALRVSVSF
jgi:porin